MSKRAKMDKKSREHRETTDPSREEQLSLLQTITMEVAAAGDFSSALKIVLRRICEKTGWVFGQAWLPNQDGTVIDCGPAWFRPKADLKQFRAASKGTHFVPGAGIPGSVWKSKQPVWIQDVTLDRNFARIKAAAKAELKGAMGIPILSGDEVLAVIEFFVHESRAEDKRLVKVITAVAEQLDLVMDRQRAQEAVREREARISLAAESANLAFWVLYPERNTAWMSEKGRVIYGFDSKLPLTWELLVSRVHSDERAAVQAAFEQARTSHGTFESEHRIVLPDGKTRWVMMRGRCLQNEHGDLLEVIGVTIDISAQKQSDLELQIQRDEMEHLNRVALVGEMTASVAHELNQPLTAIANNAAAARRFFDRGQIDPAILRQSLADIAEASHRAGEVINGIREMARKGERTRSLLNLNAVITDTLRLVRSDILIRETAVVTDFDSRLPDVKAAPVQIQQVMLNLIMNALDAVETLPPPERRIIISTRSLKGGSAEVSVRDFGTGLPADRAKKVFDHFFSTKAKGMGMGLTIARSIVEAHAGTLGAENAEGGGARFFFRLPAAQGLLIGQAA
jgi:PAS domain S-box-containing protein